MIVMKNKHVGEALRRDAVFVWHAVIAVVFIGFAESRGRGRPARHSILPTLSLTHRTKVLHAVEVFNDGLRPIQSACDIVRSDR